VLVCFGHFVDTAGMKRMAFSQPLADQPPTTHAAMTIQRVQGVVRARWMEAALTTKQGTQGELVCAHERDKQTGKTPIQMYSQRRERVYRCF